MAVAYDSAVGDLGTGSTNSWSHTCTGTNLVLYVAVIQRFADAVTGVTYNSVAMTNIGTSADTGSIIGISLWRLIGPDTGTNTVEVTLSTTRRQLGVSISFSGADQTTPNGTVVTASDDSGAGATPSMSVSSAADEIVVDFVGLQNDDNTSTLAVGADQTERANDATSNATTNGIRAACSTETGAATTTMTWTPDVADDWAGIALAVKPAGAAAAFTPRAMLLGVG